MNDDSREPPRICLFRSLLYIVKKYQAPPCTLRYFLKGWHSDRVALTRPKPVFPTFWWGGIWPGASVNAILSRSTPTTEPLLFPLFLCRPFFSCLVPYPRQWRPPLRFSLSLSCSLFWFACYKIESGRWIVGGAILLIDSWIAWKKGRLGRLGNLGSCRYNGFRG